MLLPLIPYTILEAFKNGAKEIQKRIFYALIDNEEGEKMFSCKAAIKQVTIQNTLFTCYE